MSIQLHFHNEALSGEDIKDFAERLIELRSTIKHYREDTLDKSEIFTVACTSKNSYLENLFTKMHRGESVDLKKEIHQNFTADDFNGVTLRVVKNSTVPSLVKQYKRKLRSVSIAE